MAQKQFFLTTSILFGIIALLHLLRLIFKWPAQILDYHLPLWFSLLGLLIAGSMSIWAHSFLKK